MTNIIKKENSRQPATFGSVVDQIFQNNLSRFFDDSLWGFNGNVPGTRVPVNIRETDNSFEMELIAPGIKKEEIQINVAGDTLTVSFENKVEKKEENNEEGWLQQEYRRQSFSRSFQLNDAIEAANINARYENGILHLSLPKKEKAKRISKSVKVE
jgi:HSP20 family protein